MSEALHKEFLEHWNELCQADYYREGMHEELEAAGWIELVTATADDVENTPFAYECGVEEGHPMWRLTKEGRAIFDAADEAIP